MFECTLWSGCWLIQKMTFVHFSDVRITRVQLVVILEFPVVRRFYLRLQALWIRWQLDTMSLLVELVQFKRLQLNRFSLGDRLTVVSWLIDSHKWFPICGRWGESSQRIIVLGRWQITNVYPFKYLSRSRLFRLLLVLVRIRNVHFECKRIFIPIQTMSDFHRVYFQECGWLD
jgi:hypothetical protein